MASDDNSATDDETTYWEAMVGGTKPNIGDTRPGSTHGPRSDTQDSVSKQQAETAKALADTKDKLRKSDELNGRLMASLQESRSMIMAMREELSKLSEPPGTYGTLLESDGQWADIVVGGRKLKVGVSGELEATELISGREILVNAQEAIVEVRVGKLRGELGSIVEMVEKDCAIVSGRTDEQMVMGVNWERIEGGLKPGDCIVYDAKSQLVVGKLERPEAAEAALEEVPDVDFNDIGGLDRQIEEITDALELPVLHPELFNKYETEAPKGVLLYGPPGCGKTMIAKAVARSLANKTAKIKGEDSPKSYFLLVNGPELLDKYVGESERKIRALFSRARERAEEGWPCIIFFDEIESVFKTRGSGISSDIEGTLVPQLLTELDGVEGLRNVIVIGATNREDLIDPAILRPGRLDLKIRVDRPDKQGALEILKRYLHPGLPYNKELINREGGVEQASVACCVQAVEHIYREDKSCEFLEVTYGDGTKETLHFGDFASGAMLGSVARRAKVSALKREANGEEGGISMKDVEEAVFKEFRESEDLPNTTNPDDWAKISGKKGQRITYIRTLIHREGPEAEGGREIERVATGQYL